MPVVTVRLYGGTAKTTVFEDEESYLAFDGFADIRYACFDEHARARLPAPLPPRLQILVFRKTLVSEFPDLPATIREVHARTGKLRSLPDMSRLGELESLDVGDHYIEEVTEPLAPGLRTLDLSFNRIRGISHPVPLTVVGLNLSFNQFVWDPFVDPGCNVDRNHMYNDDYAHMIRKQKERERAEWAATVAGAPRVGARQAVRLAPTKIRTVYQSAQNVHSVHVQKTVSSSVETLMRLTRDVEPLPSVDEIVAALHGRTAAYGWFETLFKAVCHRPPNLPHFVRGWCAEPTISSVHGITFGELLQRTYAVVRTHEHRGVLVGILNDELKAGHGMCFTGRYSRVISALDGFVEGVGVGLSDGEQMQARIAAAVATGAREGQAAEATRASIEEILDEFRVTDDLLRDAWLDAV